MASYGDLQFVTTNTPHSVRGLTWPWKTTNTGGMCSVNFNETAVREGLIQLLLTSRGERPMRLDYGTDLRASVFAPLDVVTINNMKDTIEAAIATYEPRIILRSLDIAQTKESELDVSLVFSMRDNVFSTNGIYLTINSKGATVNG